MQLHLKDMADVRAFSVTVTAVTLLGTLALEHLMLPAPLAAQVWFTGLVIALSLAAPLSFFIGLKLHEVHRLGHDLKEAVRHDPLTGVLTRAAFREEVATRPDVTGTLIVADIDRFKAFNDRFGHLAGDRVLRQVAQILRQGCRVDDLVARFGGEEFVLVLRDTPPGAGLHVAERLCARLRHEPVMIDSRAVTVTASFGVTGLDGLADLDAAIARADATLYRAKAAGRDRACTDWPG